jgi:hypothetical protein
MAKERSEFEKAKPCGEHTLAFERVWRGRKVVALYVVYDGQRMPGPPIHYRTQELVGSA